LCKFWKKSCVIKQIGGAVWWCAAPYLLAIPPESLFLSAKGKNWHQKFNLVILRRFYATQKMVATWLVYGYAVFYRIIRCDYYNNFRFITLRD
jgi:hypothetical protein